MDVTLIGDRVLVKVAEVKEQSEGGIFIPVDSQQDKPEGTVVCVGPGTPLKDKSVRSVAVNPGDYVHFDPARGYVLMLDEVKHVVIREDDIIAIIG